MRQSLDYAGRIFLIPDSFACHLNTWLSRMDRQDFMNNELVARRFV
jgi:hypothetical protein